MAAMDSAGSPHDARLLEVLESASRALTGTLSIPDALGAITAAVRPLLEFERVAVLRLDGPDELLVHASANGVAWTDGRRLRREDCSRRLWPDPIIPQVIGDLTTDLDPAFAMDREVVARGTRTIVQAPIAGRDGPAGMLAFSSNRPHAFGPAELRTAGAIAGLLGVALEHTRVLEVEVRRERRRAALEAVLPRLAATHDLEGIAAVLGEMAHGVVPHQILALAVLHSDDEKVFFKAVIDGHQQVVADVPHSLVAAQLAVMEPEGYVIVRELEIVEVETRRARLHCERAGQRHVIEHQFPPDTWADLVRSGMRSQVRAAVRRGPSLIGLIAFGSRTTAAYDEEDAAIVRRLADHVSLSLANERLSAEAKRVSEADQRAQALEARVLALQAELERARGPHAVVGTSKNWRDVLAHATRVAGTDTTVLLTGESGTGKEVVARFIHHASQRAGGPFVALNCAALPEHLLEAELFGHEKGAFTGAQATRPGRIEQAAGGVLFLDEVGEMSPPVQAKFLRVLQEREFQRLGSSRVLKADVRVIAATNRNLRAAISAGDFREDLYYRLHVFEIALPPLRERPEDVLTLTEHYLTELGATLGRGAAGLTADARRALTAYAWPGNARELRNVIERALILCDGGLIHPHHLAFAPAAATAPPAGAFDALADTPLPERGVDLEALERSLVRRAMAQAAGNKSRAARLLGLTRAQLYTRLEKHGL